MEERWILSLVTHLNMEALVVGKFRARDNRV